ncbi:MAG: hypothetical protein EAX96_15560 [Candidatus Lokiarchaeota archaeon]|nr:hypothetical protein [Candidatus Lokiarchaeota archaeon]
MGIKSKKLIVMMSFFLIFILFLSSFVQNPQFISDPIKNSNNDSFEIDSTSSWSNPELIGNLSEGGAPANGIFISNNLAYVSYGDPENCLVIVNITNREDPVKLGRFNLNTSANDVWVEGSTAYIANDYLGICIVNVTNPKDPQYLGTFGEATGNSSDSIQVVGTIAYVADFFDGLKIINVTDPRNPTKLNSTTACQRPIDICVVGNLVYVADAWYNMRIFDVTNPTSAVLLSSYEIPTAWVSCVQVQNNIAYVATSIGLQIVNVTNPRSPQNITRYSIYCDQIYVEGRYAFITESSSKIFEILNITCPDKLSKVGSYIHTDSLFTVNVEGGYAYIGGEYGLNIFQSFNSSQDPWSNIGKLSQFSLSSDKAYDLEVDGNLVYLATLSEGLLIIDISDLHNPVKIGNYTTNLTNTRGLDVVGSTCYIADGTAGMEIVNISNPNNPVKLGEFNTGSHTTINVQVIGSIAYICDSSYGFRTVNISNPATPIELDTYTAGGDTCYDVQVIGGYAYVSDLSRGLVILNVTNPKDIQELDSFAFMNAYGLHVVDNIAYVTSGFSPYLLIFNVTNPKSIISIANYTIPYAGDVQVVGGLAFVVKQMGITAGTGLEVLNVSNPSSAISLGNYDEYYDFGRAVEVVGDIIYVADTDDGLEIFEGLAPRINSTQNAIYGANSSETMTWTLEDNVAGGYYRVLKNESVYVPWTRWIEKINVNVQVDTNHGIGNFTYIMQYNDSAGIWGKNSSINISIYDNGPPTSNNPDNEQYVQNTTGHTIDWILYDNVSGGYYRVWRNLTVVEQWKTWNSEELIQISVNTTCGLGVWNYTIEFNDSVGIKGSPYSVYITIVQNNGPTVNNALDVIFAQFSTAYINWTLNDDVSGSHYRVLRNGTEYISWTVWASTPLNLQVPVNTSTIGLWIYEIQYNDTHGILGIPDEVIITIEAGQSPGSGPTQIPGFESIFVFLGIICLIVALNFKKKPIKI